MSPPRQPTIFDNFLQVPSPGKFLRFSRLFCWIYVAPLWHNFFGANISNYWCYFCKFTTYQSSVVVFCNISVSPFWMFAPFFRVLLVIFPSASRNCLRLLALICGNLLFADICPFFRDCNFVRHFCTSCKKVIFRLPFCGRIFSRDISLEYFYLLARWCFCVIPSFDSLPGQVICPPFFLELSYVEGRRLPYLAVVFPYFLCGWCKNSMCFARNSRMIFRKVSAFFIQRLERHISLMLQLWIIPVN